jgi:hypothetical protein
MWWDLRWKALRDAQEIIMGITLCDKHGRQGIFLVSQGVLDAMEADNADEIIRVAFLGRDDEGCNPKWRKSLVAMTGWGCGVGFVGWISAA